MCSSELRRVSTGKGETTCGYFHPDGQHILFASSHLDPTIGQPTTSPTSKPGYQRGSGRYVWSFNEHMDIFAADWGHSGWRLP